MRCLESAAGALSLLACCILAAGEAAGRRGCADGHGCVDADNAPARRTQVVCLDTAGTATWAGDGRGSGCTTFHSFPSACGTVDDDDFTSNDMCCVCGGGSSESAPAMPSVPSGDCAASHVELKTSADPHHISFHIEDSAGAVVCENPDNTLFEVHYSYNVDCCLVPGSYTVVCEDAVGDGWSGGFRRLGDAVDSRSGGESVAELRIWDGLELLGVFCRDFLGLSASFPLQLLPATPTPEVDPPGATQECVGSEIWVPCEEEVVICPGVTQVPPEALSRCGAVIRVVIPDSVTVIHPRAFATSSLSEIVLGGGLTSIGEYAFSNTPLTHLHLPDGLLEIGAYAFWGVWELSDVRIPDSVTSIGERAFQGCIGVQRVTLGASLASAGFQAFEGCCSIASVVVRSAATMPGLFPSCAPIANVAVVEGGDVGRITLGGCTYLASVVFNASAVGSEAFAGCVAISDLTFGAAVTSIGYGAFWNCSSLLAVELDNALETISADAFKDCTSLGFVRLGEAIQYVRDSAFLGCTALVAVEVPSPFPVDMRRAFGCSTLTSVTFIATVTSIEDDILKECASLAIVSMPDGVVSIGSSSFSGCSSLTHVGLPAFAVSIGAQAFSGCSSLASLGTSGDMPATLASIGSYAFHACASLVSLALPTSISFLGDHAFDGCSALQSVSWLPRSASEAAAEQLTSLADYTFVGCSSLASFEILGTVASVGEACFLGCSALEDLAIPESVARLGDAACGECNGLTSVTIPSTVAEVGQGAFRDCVNLTSASIPEAVLSRGVARVFEGCPSLASVVIDASVATIASKAFKGVSSMVSVSMPDNVTGIGESAFEDCLRLREVRVPDSVAVINAFAFHGCVELASATMGQGVEFIGASAFEGCRSLAAVELGGSVLAIGESAFAGCSGLRRVDVPSSVSSIHDRVFAGCTSLFSIVIPDSVTDFGEEVFERCASLEQAYFPPSVVSRSNAMRDAFGECSSLTTVNISDLSDQIGTDAFAGCSALAEARVPAAVISLGMAAVFEGCSFLATVVISDSVESITEAAFKGCSALLEVRIPQSVTRIEARAFEGCSSLTTVAIPPSVTLIGAAAFAGCASLTSVSVPSRVGFLGVAVFAGCSSLESATIPDALGSTVAFDDCELVTSTGGRSYYTTAAKGCLQCPHGGIAAVEICFMALLVSVLLAWLLVGGWFAASSGVGDPSYASRVAVNNTVHFGVQTLQVVVNEVPWPPRLAAMLRLMDFAALQLTTAKPECLDMPLSFAALTASVIYGVPAFLAVGYALLAARKICGGGGVARHIKSVGVALLANSYWLLIIFLQWSWQWLACGFPTVLAGGQAEAVLLVGGERGVKCQVSDGRWRILVLISLPALLVFQGALPFAMVLSANKPWLAFAVAPYRESWKRSWLVLDVVYKSCLVLCRIAFLSKVDEPGVQGRLLYRSWILVALIAAYYALMVYCKPYEPEVLMAGDGALLYGILASGITLLCFAAATPWWVGAPKAAQFSEHYEGWEEPQAEYFVATDSISVITIEVFLIGVLLLWVAFMLRALLLYSPASVLLKRLSRENPVRSSSDETSREDRSGLIYRADLGQITSDARNAVVSAPGSVGRSFDVRLKSDAGSNKWRLQAGEGGAPPMLLRGAALVVVNIDTGIEQKVPVEDISYAGIPEYEFWNNAVSRLKLLREYSFACVWVPNVSGCCRPAMTFEAWACEIDDAQMTDGSRIPKKVWARYQGSLRWIHEQLAAGYAFRSPEPECDNCAWFDFWAVNVMRCFIGKQSLRFAFLKLPLNVPQPVFECVVGGRSSFHYVGIAQQVELEWAQNCMKMPVSPISFEEDILGASSSQLRLLGTMITAKTPKATNLDPDLSRLYRQVDSLLSKRQLARARRQRNRATFCFFMFLPLALGVLRLFAAALEDNRLHRLLTLATGILLIAGGGLSVHYRYILFGALNSLFSDVDSGEDDELAREIEIRAQIGRAQSPTEAEVRRLSAISGLRGSVISDEDEWQDLLSERDSRAGTAAAGGRATTRGFGSRAFVGRAFLSARRSLPPGEGGAPPASRAAGQAPSTSAAPRGASDAAAGSGSAPASRAPEEERRPEGGSREDPRPEGGGDAADSSRFETDVPVDAHAEEAITFSQRVDP